MEQYSSLWLCAKDSQGAHLVLETFYKYGASLVTKRENLQFWLSNCPTSSSHMFICSGLEGTLQEYQGCQWLPNQLSPQFMNILSYCLGKGLASFFLITSSAFFFTTFCLKVFEALPILLSLQFVSMGELKDQSWYDLGQSLLPIET